MSKAKIYPVILSGGSGVRLWPLSRKNYPKQFLPLPDRSLFETTVRRALAIDAPSACLGGMIVVCNESQRFLASAVLSEISDLREQVGEVQIVLEPIARNTAAAIALSAFAALEMEGKDTDGAIEVEDPLLLVLPSDHEISPQENFSQAIDKGVRCAREGWLVLFGIRPLSPATGFGYIEQGEALSGLLDCGFKVSRFVEKPALDVAEKMLAAGGYFWNSGMFMFGARAYLNELKKHEPEIYLHSHAAWSKGRTQQDITGIAQPDVNEFEQAPKISIDYAVMERTSHAVIVPTDINWSDLGSFEAFYQSGLATVGGGGDADGNVSFGDVMAINSQGNYLYSQNRLLAVLGVNDLVVVETADSVLVAPRALSQDVGKFVEWLNANGRPESENPSRVPKPWGSYQVLLEAPGFKVKRIEVLSDSRLSLQMHDKRSEHWVVVEGQAQVTLDEEVFLLNKDESIYIPVKSKHRLANLAKGPLVIIEVQSGSYLGEDDIVRFADDYGREGSLA